jgi:hypothetical protein
MTNTHSRIIELSGPPEQLLTEIVSDAINGKSPIPAYLNISALDREHYQDYLKNVADRARRDTSMMECTLESGKIIPPKSKVNLTLTSDNGPIPASLAQIIGPLQKAYEHWRTETQIKRNFTSECLSLQIQIPFDHTGHPETAFLKVWYETWGFSPTTRPHPTDGNQ